MNNLFNRIIKASINLLVFLVPLFFLPFSFEAFEFNKQYLLFFLVLIASFAWVGKMVLVDQEVRFKRTPLDLFVLGFLFLAILSAIFSVDKNSSVFGFYGRFSDGLIGLLSLGVLYFLITNNINGNKLKVGAASLVGSQELSEKDQKPITANGLLKVFMWSVFFIVLISYFSVFGILGKIGGNLHFPQVTLQSIFNPVAGSLEGLAVFLAIITVFLTGIILTKSKVQSSKFKNLSNWILIAASLALLIIIDFNSSWWILLASLVLFLAFALWKRLFRENVNRLLLPIFLIVVAGLFLSINVKETARNFNASLTLNLPQEQVLGQGISWQVGFKSATDSVKSGFLGSGIGTFHYDFAKEKPASFNQNRLWQIRFDRGGSNFSEILATMGFLGLLSWLALIGMFLLISYLIVIKSSSAGTSQLPLLMGFMALIVGQFVYYQNTVLSFVFWLFLALSVVSWQKSVREIVFSFKNFPELNLVFTTVLILIGLGGLGATFFAVRFYMADRAFIQGKYEKAVKLNSYQSQYWTILARTYLRNIAENASQENVGKAIDAAKTAVLSGPGQVAAWETQGMVYRDIRIVAAGAADWAVKSFEKAIELEPTNPVLRTELAKVYMPDNLAKAKEELAKAKELKSDYADALYQDALIKEGEGDLNEAIKTMEILVLNNNFNAELRFQLGRLYYNNNRIDESIAMLETVLQIFPNHSNALYSLAVAWQKKGNINKAGNYFEKVLELNPDNQEVKERLKELEK